jgi:hypothetical protein
MGSLSVTKVLERFGDESVVVTTRVAVITTTFLNHVTSPLHQMLNPLVKANELRLQTGDLTYICYFLCGLLLKALDEDSKHFLSEMREYNQLTRITQCLLHHQAALNLMGASNDTLRLEGEAIEDLDDS